MSKKSMQNLTIIDHPLLKRDLSLLRDRNTRSEEFRVALKRLAALMVYEVTRDFRTVSYRIQTPLESTEGHKISEDVILVPVLRAGLG
ncbi:MAG: uracil phosphoribosyltransferase, partial [Candidatus Kryptoniota bacterium]